MGMRGFCRRFHLRLGCVRLTHSNIFPNGTGFQPGILQNHANLTAKLAAGHFAGLHAVYHNIARVHIIKPHEQIDQGGFAAACGAHNGNPLPRLHLQIEILNELFPLVIGKSDLPDCNASPLAAFLYRSGIRSFRLRFHQVKHPPGACQGVLQFGNHPGNLIEGLGVLVGIAEKAYKPAYR